MSSCGDVMFVTPHEMSTTPIVSKFIAKEGLNKTFNQLVSIEIGFFDFYIIPLAKKLKDCGVFGVSSDEYLNYAEENRRLWNLRGESIVEKYKLKYSNMWQHLKEDDHEEEAEVVVATAAEPPTSLRRTSSKVVITNDRGGRGGRAQQASF